MNEITQNQAAPPPASSPPPAAAAIHDPPPTPPPVALATAFPFISNSLYMPGGVLMGMTDTGEPVMLDAWDESLENPHAFIGGVTGAGKSYLGKLLIG